MIMVKLLHSIKLKLHCNFKWMFKILVAAVSVSVNTSDNSTFTSQPRKALEPVFRVVASS